MWKCIESDGNVSVKFFHSYESCRIVTVFERMYETELDEESVFNQ